MSLAVIMRHFMTNTSQSRNPFANPTVPTFADLIDRLKVDRELPKTKRQNMVWALKVIARAIGKTPAEVVAHPEVLRALLKKAAPASIGLSRAGWNNARSLLGKVLEWAGLAAMPSHYQAPFAPAWADLWELLPPGKNALRMQLSRFLHYCSAQGIRPSEVNDAVLSSFHEGLMAESIVEQPYEIYRGTARSWNNSAERIAGWPQQRVTVPSKQYLFNYGWSAFPASLGAAVETYCRRAEGLDLSDDHFVRRQRPATIETRRWQLRLLATAIAKAGIPVETLTSLSTMLQPPTAAAGLQYLLDRNDGSSSPQISHLATFLPTLARRLDMPDEIVAKLRKMAAKLKVVQHGMAARHREALRAFDDEAAVKALLGLAAELVEEVLKVDRQRYREAKIVQTALAIELLLNAPVRIKNLASIEVDRHFVPVGRQDLHLRFPAHEVKNANDLEFPLMAEAIDLLDLYLKVWRPILCDGQASPFLFPGAPPDRPKGKGTLSSQVKEVVFAHTRLDMPAHRFRHAVGKIFLDRNPGQYEVVRLLLGHKSIETTTSFYAGAESASAARHYARTILGIRGRDLPAENR
jgi:integrase